jgi:hypothetical protein
LLLQLMKSKFVRLGQEKSMQHTCK